MMSLAIDNQGGVWIWGNYPQQSSSPEEGLSFMSTFTPSPVKDLLGHTVVKVACGTEHIVALVSTGKANKGDDVLCYSWGSNKHGQLGLGDTQRRHHPEIVETFNQNSPWEIYEVACGSLHTALLARKKPPSDTHESTCWTFGLGENGQLGHGTTKNAVSPQQVKGLPDSLALISVDCGLFHTSVLSSSGEAWSWGMERGLGLCPGARVSAVSGDAVLPLLISCSEQNAKFDKPVQVACGAAHTVLVANDGYKMWSWGRGRSGVLGNGKTDDCLSPTPVLWPEVTEGDKQVETKTDNEEVKTEEKDSKQVAETDENLPSAMEKMKVLESRLSTMEQYASILHGSIFGKPFEERDIPISLQYSGTFDVAKEWENMLELADRAKLVRLEMFYRNMLAGVKDQLMKKRIQEVMKECLNPSARGN
ncbi:ultraviolet-B receptor UVR8 isoform X1 [Humulus lupulus]|nr:ultraviolet-B receptor UVR8 isoform X1 [Humulus lupulus]